MSILSLFLHFSLARAAEAPVLTYTLAEGADPDEPEGYTFTRYEVGAKPWVLGPGAHLHAEGAAASKAGRLLPIGTPVEVLEVGAAVEEADGRMDTWYRVASPLGEGWVHGGGLSPFGWSVDADLDGEVEFVGVTVAPDFNPRVVVVEPNPRTAPETWVDVDAAGGAYIGVKGSSATAELLKAKVAGVPLVHVRAFVEACGDHADYWVSYRTAAPGEIGTARIALTTTGLTDPPSFAACEVAFDGKRKVADTTCSTWTTDDAGKKQGVESESSRWVLIDGVYKREVGGRIER